MGGTPEFMAPEVWSGIYGHLVFCILVGVVFSLVWPVLAWLGLVWRGLEDFLGHYAHQRFSRSWVVFTLAVFDGFWWVLRALVG